MRISELSRATGVSIPTIKFYLREGLLPPGTRIAPRQADYSEAHVRRLRLIGALTHVGGLSLRSVHAVLAAIDDPSLPVHEMLGVAHRALSAGEDGAEGSPEALAARRDVDAFLSTLRWRVSADAPARRSLARALVTLRRLGRDVDAGVFAPYARAAERLAAREVATLEPARERGEAVEAMVVGTVVFEAALVALRRLAQEHHSAVRFSRRR